MRETGKMEKEERKMTTTTFDLQTVTPAMVIQAYVGKAGKCACGCAGKHYLYKEDPKRGGVVNQTMVTKILRTIQANEADARAQTSILDPQVMVIAVTIGKKLYFV